MSEMAIYRQLTSRRLLSHYRTKLRGSRHRTKYKSIFSRHDWSLE